MLLQVTGVHRVRSSVLGQGEVHPDVLLVVHGTYIYLDPLCYELSVRACGADTEIHSVRNYGLFVLVIVLTR